MDELVGETGDASGLEADVKDRVGELVGEVVEINDLEADVADRKDV